MVQALKLGVVSRILGNELWEEHFESIGST